MEALVRGVRRLGRASRAQWRRRAPRGCAGRSRDWRTCSRSPRLLREPQLSLHAPRMLGEDGVVAGTAAAAPRCRRARGRTATARRRRETLRPAPSPPCRAPSSTSRSRRPCCCPSSRASLPARRPAMRRDFAPRGIANHARIVPGARCRSPMVSKSGTICTREVGARRRAVTSPTSFSRTATSRISDTLSVFEITYWRIAAGPSRS